MLFHKRKIFFPSQPPARKKKLRMILANVILQWENAVQPMFAVSQKKLKNIVQKYIYS